MVAPRAKTLVVLALIQLTQSVAVRAAMSIYGFSYQDKRGRTSTMSFPHSSAEDALYGVYEYYYVPDNSASQTLNEIEPNRANRSVAAAVCEARGANWTLLSLHSDMERDYVLSQGATLLPHQRRFSNYMTMWSIA